jgi:ArsR family transcriptional regulator, arsenate/arsenite/antimonite-responsive transcriptional repressor
MATPLLRASPLFAALADLTRLAILDRLRSGERSVNELCGDTAARQSLMSFHLKTLRDAGLVFTRKDGRTVWYALDPSGLARLERVVKLLRGDDDDAAQTSKRVDLEVCMEYINDG